MAYEPKLTEAAEAFHDNLLSGRESVFCRTDPEFMERFANFAFDEVIEKVDLDDRTRYLGWLATLLGCQGVDEFRSILPVALRDGVTPVEVKEVVYQAVAYLGIGCVRPFMKVVNEVLEAQGIELSLPPQANTEPTRESRLAAGEQAQVDIFGEAMRGFKDKGHPDYPHINEWLVSNCFGDWYTRGGLDLRDRELVTFCYIAAQGGCDSQLRGHAAGNLSVGNTRELLIRVISSNLPFIGYPRTLNALAALDAVEPSAE
jgi:4-carboxymuconolactone decarboxylase